MHYASLPKVIEKKLALRVEGQKRKRALLFALEARKKETITLTIRHSHDSKGHFYNKNCLLC